MIVRRDGRKLDDFFSPFFGNNDRFKGFRHIVALKLQNVFLIKTQKSAKVLFGKTLDPAALCREITSKTAK